jgi:predicted O-methyltransferase YrrM
MNDDVRAIPGVVDAILRDTAAIGFTMASEPKTGSLLRVLAASKPAANVLELGTGTGVGTAWLLEGMDAAARLTTVENDRRAQEVARRHLGADSRVTFRLEDAGAFLTSPRAQTFDLIYADTWAGKFTHLEDALALVRPGGFYVVDDLLPQPNWPDGHAAKLPPLLAQLEQRTDFAAVTLAWATGLLLLVRTRSI